MSDEEPKPPTPEPIIHKKRRVLVKREPTGQDDGSPYSVPDDTEEDTEEDVCSSGGYDLYRLEYEKCKVMLRILCMHHSGVARTVLEKALSDLLKDA